MTRGVVLYRRKKMVYGVGGVGRYPRAFFRFLAFEELS